MRKLKLWLQIRRLYVSYWWSGVKLDWAIRRLYQMQHRLPVWAPVDMREARLAVCEAMERRVVTLSWPSEDHDREICRFYRAEHGLPERAPVDADAVREDVLDNLRRIIKAEREAEA